MNFLKEKKQNIFNGKKTNILNGEKNCIKSHNNKFQLQVGLPRVPAFISEHKTKFNNSIFS